MPVPMMAPIPSVTRLRGPRTRLRECSPLAAASAFICSIDFVAKIDMEVPFPRVENNSGYRPGLYMVARPIASRYGTCRASPSAERRQAIQASARRYSRTRCSGSPVRSKSLITATDVAPASITRAAVSTVMPPIASSGRFRAAVRFAATRTRSSRARSAQLWATVFVPRGLRGRAEDRSDRDVADRAFHCPRDLSVGMCRDADHCTIADHSPRVPWRQIVLPHVHPVGIRETRDIAAIVDDDNGAGAVSARHDRRCRVEHCRGRHRLRTQLQEARSAAEVGVGEVHRRPPGLRCAVGIDDRVQSRDSGLGIWDSPGIRIPNPESPIPVIRLPQAGRRRY